MNRQFRAGCFFHPFFPAAFDRLFDRFTRFFIFLLTDIDKSSGYAVFKAFSVFCLLSNQ